MTERTVSNAVAQQEEQRDTSPRALLLRWENSFARVLPRSLGMEAPAFVAIVDSILKRDKKLREAAQASPDSLIHALLHCASLGHVPGQGYALTVRKRKGDQRSGEPSYVEYVLGMEEYTGMVARMYRSNAIASVKAQVVHANDLFDWDPNTMDRPYHKFKALDTDAQRGQIVGVYAYAEFKDGTVSQVVVFNADEILKRRRKAAQDHVWVEWPKEQTLKTALRRLRHFVPMSNELLAQTVLAEAERATAAEKLGPPPAEYDDDLVLDDGPDDEEREVVRATATREDGPR